MLGVHGRPARGDARTLPAHSGSIVRFTTVSCLTIVTIANDVSVIAKVRVTVHACTTIIATHIRITGAIQVDVTTNGPRHRGRRQWTVFVDLHQAP